MRSPASLLYVAEAALWLGWFVADRLGLLTRKETFSAWVVITFIACLASVILVITGSRYAALHAIAVAFDAAACYISYRSWKNEDDDDDDDAKRQRHIWAKSHLPEPTTKALTNPGAASRTHVGV